MKVTIEHSEQGYTVTEDNGNVLNHVESVELFKEDGKQYAAIVGEGYSIARAEVVGSTNLPQGAAVPAGVDVTEAALELATEKGIDLTTVEGTGKDGRITIDDVKAASGE